MRNFINIKCYSAFLLLFFIVSCGGKYYSSTSNGIMVNYGGNKLFLSALDSKVISVSQSELSNIENEFKVTETDSTVIFSTAEISALVNPLTNQVIFTDSLLETIPENKFTKVENDSGYLFIYGDNLCQRLCILHSLSEKKRIPPKTAFGFTHLTSSSDELKKLHEIHFSIDNTRDILLESLKRRESDDLMFTPSLRTLDGQLKESLEQSTLGGSPYWSLGQSEKVENTEKWKEIQTRRFQIGAFSPFFTYDGPKPAEISAPNSNYYKSILYYDKLRYSLLPYIYSLSAMVTNGKRALIAEPLYMAFPTDTTAQKIGDQYMFGPSLMVCPITCPAVRKRDVYLPSGQIWYDFNSPDKIYEGGQTISVDVTIERIPVFVPSGAILAIGQKADYVGQIRKDDRVDLDIDIYGGQDGKFEIYDDDGSSLEYLSGSRCVIPVEFIQSPRTIIIGTRKGEFSSMAKNRNIHVAVYSEGKKKAINVYYEGAKIKISL